MNVGEVKKTAKEYRALGLNRYMVEEGTVGQKIPSRWWHIISDSIERVCDTVGISDDWDRRKLSARAWQFTPPNNLVFRDRIAPITIQLWDGAEEYEFDLDIKTNIEALIAQRLAQRKLAEALAQGDPKPTHGLDGKPIR